MKMQLQVLNLEIKLVRMNFPSSHFSRQIMFCIFGKMLRQILDL